MRLLLDLNKSELGCLTLIKVSFYIIKILRNISDNYMPWCCYSLCCPSFAMYSLGVKLDEKWRFHYVLIGALPAVCYAFLQYFQDQLLYPGFNGIDDETTINSILILKLAILIPVCLLLGLAIRQRMRFFKQPGHKEPLGFSCFASVCCLPCSYGQMGAVELQTV